LTQEFFTTLLEKGYVKVANRQRGKFRSFLLASLNHFLAKQRRRADAEKRGGGILNFSLEFKAGEDRYSLEPSHSLTAEQVFERRWALTLLELTFARLREEFTQAGKLELYHHLKVYLTGDQRTVPYGELADRLGMTEGAIKVAVHRLRRRCRELLREEIAQTVAGPEEVDEELRDLFKAVGQ
jgi:DNA-directed RNA polymerase specialized sigma24 family protein